MLATIRQQIPVLPEERIEKYTKELSLPAYDAGVLADEKEIADYFEQLIQHTAHYKAAAN